MADHTATLAVNLEDGTSAPALTAADALKQLQEEILAGTKALTQMNRALKNLQGGTKVNEAAVNKLKEQITAKKQAIAQAQQSVLALGGGFNSTTPKAGKMTSILEQLTKQAAAMPGPVSTLTVQFASLANVLAGGIIAAGVLGIAAALVALTAATAGAIAMLTRYGIAQADARRSEHLRLEGLTKLRFWYRAAAGSAHDLQKTVDRVSDNSALGRAELLKYTDQLYRMGLRGNNLSEALEGVAIKAVTQGDAAASAFAGMAAGAALTGRSVHAMTEKVRARLGGLAMKHLLALDVQTQKLRESFEALFRDVNLDKFLGGLREVFKLFSQTTITGRVLKGTIEGMLQPLIDGVALAAPYVKRFAQGLLLGFLRLGITVLRLRRVFRDTWGDWEVKRGIDSLTVAVYAGQAAVWGLGAALAFTAGLFVLVTAPIWATVRGIYALWQVGKLIYQYFANLDWDAIGVAIGMGLDAWLGEGAGAWAKRMYEFGGMLVAGLVKGLQFAGRLMLGPVLTDLAMSAKTAFEKALGIQSPSKVFAELGLAIPEGVAAGVEQGTPATQGAVNSMVEVPGAGAGGAGGAGARGPVLSIGELHFHANGGEPRSAAEDFRRELERVLEGLAISLGAPVPGGV